MEIGPQLKEWMEQKDPGIKRCIEVARSPRGFYYFIETKFATFPRFVVGEMFEDKKQIRLLLRCGTEISAREFWNDLTSQKLGGDFYPINL